MSPITTVRHRSLLIVGMLVALVAPAGVAAAADYSPKPAGTWTPTAGRVYSVVRVGDTILLGGTFTSLRSPDRSTTQSRAGLAALSATTGALLPWNPGTSVTSTSGHEVRALATSSDGATVYVGGTFTSLAGQPTTGFGAVSASTGAAVPGFKTTLEGGGVQALVRNGSSLVLGGSFTRINGIYQSRLAAVDVASGARISTFKASASSRVSTLELSADRSSLLVGGTFRSLSGVARDYLGSVSASTGAATSWAPPAACLVDTNPCHVFDVVTDGGRVYAAVGGPGGQVRAYDAASGRSLWDGGTDGDVQAVALDGSTLYAGGHFDTSFADKPRAGLVALATDTGAVRDDFAPLVLGGTGIWSIHVGPDRLRVGGHFGTVDGVVKERYAEFPAVSSPDPAPAPATLVPRGSTWAYLDNGVAPSSSWTSSSFDDSSWKRGAAQLGFGDGDEQTVMTKGHITYWMRSGFSVADPSVLKSATLSLKRDDGAAVYVNGVEVVRTNLPSGTITSSTLATAVVDGSAESAWTTYSVPVSVLRAGSNVITAEVHQSSTGSSDTSFDLGLDVA